MKEIVAIIPFSVNEYENKIFEKNIEVAYIKKVIEKNGYDVITYDLVTEKNRDSVKYYFFMNLDFRILYELIYIYKIRRGLIYFAKEPETVIPEDSQRGLRFLRKVFEYVITPYDELADGERVFKYWGLHNWQREPQKGIPFEDRKLLVNISGYKFSDNPKEMYSERIRIIRELEDEESFDFFGIGEWERLGSKNYQGVVEKKYKDKYECYQYYRFALALENSRKLKGYYTEKLTDCFRAGIVPIYLPFDGLEDLIPANCYINYEKFQSAKEMYDYLSAMGEEEWKKYLEHIEKFLDHNTLPEFEKKYIDLHITKVLHSSSEWKADAGIVTRMYILNRKYNFTKRLKNKLLHKSR